MNAQRGIGLVKLCTRALAPRGEELLALRDGHREAGLAARARVVFAVGFDHFRMQTMIGLHKQVGTYRTFLLLDIDLWVDKLVGDNFEAYYSRLEQHRGLLGIQG
jgi:hypothetical protein